MLYCKKTDCVYKGVVCIAVEAYNEWLLMRDGEWPHTDMWCDELGKLLWPQDCERLFSCGSPAALPREADQCR